MARAEASISINCPVSKVFTYLVDIPRGTEWQGELVEVQQTSSGPMATGATFREVRRLLGRNLETVFIITEYEPDGKLGFEATSGPIPIRGYYSLDGTVNGTNLTLVVEAELTGVFKMTEPLLVHTARRQMEADIAKLKEILETG